MSDQDNNKLLRIRSGEVNINDKLTSFLYELMRDHLPPGIVETLVRNSGTSEVRYTNGWLAKYAEDLSKRLKKEEADGNDNRGQEPLPIVQEAT
jgi:hypothetical protein